MLRTSSPSLRSRSASGDANGAAARSARSTRTAASTGSGSAGPGAQPGRPDDVHRAAGYPERRLGQRRHQPAVRQVERGARGLDRHPGGQRLGGSVAASDLAELIAQGARQ